MNNHPSIDYSKMYFTIKSLEDENVVSIKNVNCSILPTFYYSIDNGETWDSITATQARTLDVVTVNTDDTILFKSTQASLATDWNQYNCFQCSKNFIIYGNIMSLLQGDNFINNGEFDSNSKHNLVGLFRDSTTLLSAKNLILPAMTVTGNAYNCMFRGCINLEDAPKLPATTLKITPGSSTGGNYSSMFEGCINLLKAPELPATTLVPECYVRMFCMDRNKKITTPKMTKSPVLPAQVVPASAYKEMFSGNGNMSEVTCLATNISALNAVAQWLKNTSETGIFYKAATMDSWPRTGNTGIPSTWTVEDYI